MHHHMLSCFDDSVCICFLFSLLSITFTVDAAPPLLFVFTPIHTCLLHLQKVFGFILSITNTSFSCPFLLRFSPLSLASFSPLLFVLSVVCLVLSRIFWFVLFLANAGLFCLSTAKRSSTCSSSHAVILSAFYHPLPSLIVAHPAFLQFMRIFLHSE